MRQRSTRQRSSGVAAPAARGRASPDPRGGRPALPPPGPQPSELQNVGEWIPAGLSSLVCGVCPGLSGTTESSGKPRQTKWAPLSTGDMDPPSRPQKPLPCGKQEPALPPRRPPVGAPVTAGPGEGSRRQGPSKTGATSLPLRPAALSRVLTGRAILRANEPRDEGWGAGPGTHSTRGLPGDLLWSRAGVSPR